MLSGGLCPFCDAPWPNPASDHLRRALSIILPRTTPEPTEANIQHREGSLVDTYTICSRHAAEETAFIAEEWPNPPDFATLGGRARHHLSALRSLIAHPEGNAIYDELAEKYNEGVRFFTQKGTSIVTELAHCG